MVDFDARCQAAINLAKSALPEGKALDVVPLMAALYHVTDFKDRFKDLGPAFKDLEPALKDPLPVPKPEKVPKVPVAAPLEKVLGELEKLGRLVTAEDLFRALLQSDPGHAFLAGRGLEETILNHVIAALAPPWRLSPERQQALEQLGEFGRMLTAVPLRDRRLTRREKEIQGLVANLSRWKNRSTIIIGPPGSGKTALVYELAWRLAQGHESIPEPLRDLDVFELTPSFLRAGTSLVGQYDQRVKQLIRALEACPKIVLFVDEVHSLLQSGMHHEDPFSKANESFKGPINRGDLTVIGCTTLAEYKAYIEPDAALAERFSVLRLAAPTAEETLEILQARRPQMEEYYQGLKIPDAVLRQAVALTDEYLPARSQPRKSLRLLDEACAACKVAKPPLTEVTEEVLARTLENAIGRGLVRRQRLTVDDVYNRLCEQLVGQDRVLKKVAELFVAGLGELLRDSGPRGVFLFGGPTGVGKTETALQLAQVLGGGSESLIRIDCNTLRGSGWDSREAVSRLIGIGPGWIGYVRGQGGLLSRVRDLPECVVLFDEIEKADPGVGKLLLQIMDSGQAQDAEGTLLDFRRSFLIFTTNAGCTYHSTPKLGFLKGKELSDKPTVETAALFNELQGLGFGPEFCGRIDQVFLFQSLEDADIRRLVERHLDRLRDGLRERGMSLDWDPAVVEHVAARWKSHFGVRALTAILRNRILVQLSIAQAQGELEGVRQVRIELAPAGRPDKTGPAAGSPWRERRTDTVIIYLPTYEGD